MSEIVDLRTYRLPAVPEPNTDTRRAAGVADLSGRRADERLRTVFEYSPLGQIVSDLTGVVVAVNAPMAEMLGYETDAMLGHEARVFVATQEHEGVVADARRLATGEADRTSACRSFVHRDGHEVRVSVTSALLRGDDDEPRWWISMVRDITDEEQSRRALEHAHAASVRANDRLQTMHAIAVAANDSAGLRDIAPAVLDGAMRRANCVAAALLSWPPGVDAATVRQSAGEQQAWTSWPRPCSMEVEVRRTADGAAHVLVPFAGTAQEVLGLAFVLLGEPEADELELLSLFKTDMSRVLERENAANRLQVSETRFRSIFDASPLPMGLTLGQTGTYSAVNPALCTLLGRAPEELVGHSAAVICHPDDLHLADPAGAAALAAPDRSHCFELRLLHASGRVIPSMVTLTWMDGPDHELQLLAQVLDLTDRQTAEAALRRSAEQDPLTGLANRVRLNRELAEFAERGSGGTALFIDLDAFKLINGTRGHDIGDQVLCAVADRLRVIGRDHLIARFGGDQFVLLRASAGEAADTGDANARAMAESVRTALAPPIATSGGQAQVTASVGIARGRVDPLRPQGLVERADVAMHEAKRLGRDRWAMSDSALRQRTVSRRRTEAALRNALDESRFVVHYQPIVLLQSREIVGFESLVRLVDEQGQLVPPTEFISVAEQSGLIVPMGAWVLQESCRRVARLRARTGRLLTVSVNVAARQAARPDFAESVLRVVTDAGLPEQALALELTESALLEADDTTLRQLTELRSHGVKIALDDFGTGYSSLTYLQQFPVSHLKVDRSFVAGMMLEPHDRAIVRAVTGLAADLGITWVAEGVETIEQHASLVDLSPETADHNGAALGQGWLYGRPIPGAQLPGLFE